MSHRDHAATGTAGRAPRTADRRPCRWPGPSLGSRVVTGPQPDEETLAFAHRLFELAREGGTAELAGHLDAGLSPDLTNHKGDTLLLLAAYHDHPDTVRVLLEHSADTGRANDRGQTALAAAVFRRSTVTVGLLLAAGADSDAGGPSARETARFFELPEMAALLDGVG